MSKNNLRLDEMRGPISCDTFVCLPPCTENNSIIFGKNSDRPEGEVQEIVHHSRQVYPKGTKLRTTYIDIDQVEETYGVILSKISWMWGVEMGANEFGVCIGNEAVWTNMMNSKEDLEKRLLGMDLVRLGLERSETAQKAVHVIAALLEKYGQGGPCSDSIKNWSYHNSYLIADRKEAWVLETAGNLWAAEKIESGYRNISNSLSIGSKMDLKSSTLESEAFKLGLWDGKEALHFAKTFSQDYDPEGDGRFTGGRNLLKILSKNGQFDLKSMISILRDETSGICMGCDGSFVSSSSQVSVLSSTEDYLDCHWFTGTPDPMNSLFKPFFFIDDLKNKNGAGNEHCMTNSVKSPSENDKEFALFKGKVDRRHELYKSQQSCYRKLISRPEVRQKLRELEDSFVEGVNTSLKSFKDKQIGDEEVKIKLKSIFNDSVSAELEFYEAECRIVK